MFDYQLLTKSEMAKSPETEHPVQAIGYAASDTSGILSPFKFSRRYIIHTFLFMHVSINEVGSYQVLPEQNIVKYIVLLAEHNMYEIFVKLFYLRDI